MFFGILVKPLLFPNLHPQLTIVSPIRNYKHLDYDLDFFINKLDFLSLTYHYTDEYTDPNSTSRTTRKYNYAMNDP